MQQHVIQRNTQIPTILDFSAYAHTVPRLFIFSVEHLWERSIVGMSLRKCYGRLVSSKGGTGELVAIANFLLESVLPY